MTILQTVTKSVCNFLKEGSRPFVSSMKKRVKYEKNDNEDNYDDPNESEETPSYDLYLSIESLLHARKDITDLNNEFIDRRYV